MEIKWVKAGFTAEILELIEAGYENIVCALSPLMPAKPYLRKRYDSQN